MAPPPELFGTSTMAALRQLLGSRGGGRAPAFEPAEGSGCVSGLLDGPLALAKALLAAGGAAAEPGQSVIRTNVGNLAVELLKAAAAVGTLAMTEFVMWPLRCGVLPLSHGTIGQWQYLWSPSLRKRVLRM